MSVVLITGCSTGIGLAAASHLAKNGHKVYATMRNPANSALPAIVNQELLPVDILSLDVNDDQSVKKAIKQVIDQEGLIDVLVNNAGTSELGAIEEMPLESFRSDMETNYFGTLRCIQAVLPSMRERRKGLIINVSSVAGRVYSNFHGTYAPTKAAVEALSECLAQEVQPFGIRVALVQPGIIETPIFSKNYSLPEKTNYPNVKRFLSMFAAAVDNHVSPEVVANVITDLVEGRSTQFRNPAGPDAVPLMEWRASMKDEEWISSTSIDDETWTTFMEEQMGVKVRRYMEDVERINFKAMITEPLNSCYSLIDN